MPLQWALCTYWMFSTIRCWGICRHSDHHVRVRIFAGRALKECLVFSLNVITTSIASLLQLVRYEVVDCSRNWEIRAIFLPRCWVEILSAEQMLGGNNFLPASLCEGWFLTETHWTWVISLNTHTSTIQVAWYITSRTQTSILNDFACSSNICSKQH